MIATATLYAAQSYHVANRDDAEPIDTLTLAATMGFDLWMATIVFG